KPPEEPGCWGDVRNSYSFASACMQPNAPMSSEDCLYLNVWKPQSATATSGLPVMVFIHGGGNMTGSAFDDFGTGQPLYDGQQLAERGHVIVVTVQYRLNLFGYLATAGLANESEHHAAGNYGLLDQIAALHSVDSNNRGFGRDL